MGLVEVVVKTKDSRNKERCKENSMGHNMEHSKVSNKKNSNCSNGHDGHDGHDDRHSVESDKKDT